MLIGTFGRASLRSDIRKPRQGAAVDHDRFAEHRGRADPQPTFIVECLVDDERLQRLGMARETEHAVRVAFVMQVAAGSWVGWKRREGRSIHGT
jgi:hypothetical protein